MFGKILEMILTPRSDQLLDKSHLSSLKIFGFRPGMSPIAALTKLVADIARQTQDKDNHV